MIIICLGNPGTTYQSTRHNIGFRVGERLIKTFGIQARGKKFHSLYFEGTVQTTSVRVLFPQTYMNESGKAVHAILSFYKKSPTECLVIADELDLLFGTIRLTESGSAGTHNGLKSIVQAIGTQFVRLRVGIGPKPAHLDCADFVLSPFDSLEESKMEMLLEKSVSCIETAISSSIQVAMNMFN